MSLSNETVKLNSHNLNQCCLDCPMIRHQRGLSHSWYGISSVSDTSDAISLGPDNTDFDISGCVWDTTDALIFLAALALFLTLLKRYQPHLDTANMALEISETLLMPKQWCYRHCWCRISSVSDTAHSSFLNLLEFWTEFEECLGYNSGAHMELTPEIRLEV